MRWKLGVNLVFYFPLNLSIILKYFKFFEIIKLKESVVLKLKQFFQGLVLHSASKKVEHLKTFWAFLNEEWIQTMDWAAWSPNLNPIEHVWDTLGRRVRARDPAPETIQQLRDFLQDEWENLDHYAGCTPNQNYG